MGAGDVQIGEVRAVALVHVVVDLEEGAVRVCDDGAEERAGGNGFCGLEIDLVDHGAENACLGDDKSISDLTWDKAEFKVE